VTEEYLPEVYLRLRSRFPAVAGAFDTLGEVSEKAGPLDERTQRLVKLGIAIGASAEGAVRSGTRRALAAGASPEEILQVAILAITTRGFPAAVAAFSWIDVMTSIAPSPPYSAMPITSPSMSRSGPPELPGLRAASVWIKPVRGLPSMSTVRLRPLTTPVVSVIGPPSSAAADPLRR
jgi:alkylhydroperoxidase/carboxymuconolactone decarboxylase family protein YurZ